MFSEENATQEEEESQSLLNTHPATPGALEDQPGTSAATPEQRRSLRSPTSSSCASKLMSQSALGEWICELYEVPFFGVLISEKIMSLRK